VTLRTRLVLVALACAGCAQAQTVAQMEAQSPTCPDDFSSAPQASPADAADALARLTPLSLICEESGRYHAYKGALLLALQRNPEAAIALEKALLLDPEQPGALMDYAQALADAGQKSAARDLVQDALQRPDMPDDLRRKLTQANEQPAPSAWRVSGHLQTTLGYEANLTNATSAEALTLFLSNGPISIPLADTERPRGGTALKLGGAIDAAVPLGGGALRLNAAMTERKTEGLDSANLSFLNAGAAWAFPLGPGALSVGMALNQVSIGQKATYADTTLHLKYETTPGWAGCQWAPQLGASNMSYPQATNLNGNYRFTRLELACGSDLQQSRAIITTGVDTPDDPTRPGGIRDRHELQLRHDHMLGASQISLWARRGQTQDRDIYSELLGSIKTETLSTSIGLGWWHPFSGRWSYGIELESTSQTSNNSLNNINNFSIYTGLRWTVR
jgi:tetratricopeptide (TPR) repeat protein